MARPKWRRRWVEVGEWIYRQPFEQPPGSKRWRVRKRHVSTGQVVCITLKAETSMEASEEIQKLARPLPEGGGESSPSTMLGGEGKRLSLGQALDSWLKTLDARPSTLKEYESSTKVYKRELGELTALEDITLSKLEEMFISWKEAKPKSRKQVRSGRTKLKHLQFLKRFFNWAVSNGFVRTNPAALYVAPKAWSKELARAKEETGQALTFEEAKLLLEKCKEKYEVTWKRQKKLSPKRDGKCPQRQIEFDPPEHLHLFVLIALRTGLRASNILNLTWQELDLKEKVLHIQDRNKMKNDMPFKAPLHEELVVALRIHHLNLGSPEEGNLFQFATLRRSFRNALKRAKLGEREFRIHDLRHTFASWLGESSPHAIMQRLLGHSAKSITDRYSQHQEIEKQRAELNKLPWLT